MNLFYRNTPTQLLDINVVCIFLKFGNVDVDLVSIYVSIDLRAIVHYLYHVPVRKISSHLSKILS